MKYNYMKRTLIFATALIAMSAISCSTEMKETARIEDEPKGEPVLFTAGLPGTKTAFAALEDNKYPNFWSEGDKIAVNGVTSSEVSAESVGTHDATFAVDGVQAPFLAVYPASAVTSGNGSEAAFAIPTAQTWFEGTYDPSAMVMIAADETEPVLTFKPAVTIIRVGIEGEGSIKSVSLSGNGKKIAGGFTVAYDKLDALTPADDIATEITVTSAEPVSTDKYWFITFLAGDYQENGLKITATTSEDKEYTLNLEPAKAYSAGTVYSATLDLEDPGSDAPLAKAAKTSIYDGEVVSLSFNRTDYPAAENVKWTVSGDETEYTGDEFEAQVWGTAGNEGKLAAKITVTAEVGQAELSTEIDFSVNEYFFSMNTWTDAQNKFKNTNIVFSPDKKTAYILTYNNSRNLVAINLESGLLKWEYTIGGTATNGAWINVNPTNGDIYCTSATDYYAIKDEGTKASQIWKAEGIVATGCGCGISADGATLYVASTTTFYALKASDGTTLGSYTTGLSGATCILVVSPEEVMIWVRYAADNNLQFLNVSNPAEITKTTGLKLPTRAADICSASISPDKKLAYVSSDCYINCIDLENRAIKKSVELSTVNNYLTCGHVVGSDGTVCVVYAQTTSQAQMTLFTAGLEEKVWDWAPESHKNTFNYSCPNMDTDGNFYITCRLGEHWFVNKATGKGTLIYKVPTTEPLQAPGAFCDDLILTIHNTAPGYIFAKRVKTTRNNKLWSGPGGDICATNCIATVIK